MLPRRWLPSRPAPAGCSANPLPLIVALVIAGVDVVETSFLLLVVGAATRLAEPLRSGPTAGRGPRSGLRRSASTRGPRRAPIRGRQRRFDVGPRPGPAQLASAKTSAGVPSRVTRPASMTTTRANDSATKRMSWLIAITVRPAACELARRCAWIRSTPRRSWPVVGSSRTTIGVRHRQDRGERQQLALARSRGRTDCGPPRRPGPTAASAASTAASSAAPRRPRLRGPNATSVRTRPAKICRSGSWKTSPTRAASAATRRSAVGRPSSRTSPAVGRSRPLRCRTRVDLPLPFWPMIATGSPSAIAQVDAVERPRPAGIDVDRGRRARSSRAARRVEAGAAWVQPLAPESPRARRTPRRRLRRPSPRAGRPPAPSPVGPSRTIRPSSTDHDPLGRARRAGPSCARRSGARCPSPRPGRPASRRPAVVPGRVELARRLVEDQDGRPQGQDARPGRPAGPGRRTADRAVGSARSLDPGQAASPTRPAR